MGKTRRYDRWTEIMKVKNHKTSLLLSLLAAMMFYLSSCKFNSDYQGYGVETLQGSWVEDNVPYEIGFRHDMKLQCTYTCDSVYITIKKLAEHEVILKPCYQNGKWVEYAKGVYGIREDSLLIEATSTHDNWKQKLTGSYHI